MNDRERQYLANLREIYIIAYGLTLTEGKESKNIMRMANLANAIVHDTHRLEHRICQLQIQAKNLQDYAKHKGIKAELKVYRNSPVGNYEELTEDEVAAGKAEWAMEYSDD